MDRSYLQACVALSGLSSCLKMKVACLIVRKRDKRIVAQGYNGTAPGKENCCEYWEKKGITAENASFGVDHRKFSERYETHAEMNALMHFRSDGHQESDTYIVYCTHAPCTNCAKHMRNFEYSISKVVYKYLYRRDTGGLEILNEDHDVEMLQLNDDPV